MRLVGQSCIRTSPQKRASRGKQASTPPPVTTATLPLTSTEVEVRDSHASACQCSYVRGEGQSPAQWLQERHQEEQQLTQARHVQAHVCTLTYAIRVEVLALRARAEGERGGPSRAGLTVAGQAARRDLFGAGLRPQAQRRRRRRRRKLAALEMGYREGCTTIIHDCGVQLKARQSTKLADVCFISLTRGLRHSLVCPRRLVGKGRRGSPDGSRARATIDDGSNVFLDVTSLAIEPDSQGKPGNWGISRSCYQRSVWKSLRERKGRQRHQHTARKDDPSDQQISLTVAVASPLAPRHPAAGAA